MSDLLPLFPLSNVVLFPNVFLPLHIFEPRFREMVSDALDSDRPDLLAPVELDAPGTTWRDGDPTASWLYFYKVFNATDCGTLGE